MGADVAVAPFGAGVVRRARTNRTGHFTVIYPGDQGDYLLTVTAIGFTPKRVQVKRVADEAILVADVQLARAAPLLDTVRIATPRQRVPRREAHQPDIGGNEVTVSGDAVGADRQGDLNAMAAMVPGAVLVTGPDGDPAGFSALGLPPDQNSFVLNGYAFAGSSIPRDANASMSSVTTPYDVSRGGFSGAQVNVRPGVGSNFVSRFGSLSVNSPPLQWTDGVAQALGQEFTNISAGGALAGPLVFDKAYYSLSLQAGRRTNDARTLLSTDALGLQASGIAADSARRLMTLLGAVGVPTDVNGTLPRIQQSDNASLLSSLDLIPANSSTSQTLNLTLTGNWSRQAPSHLAVTDVPARGGERRVWNLGAQATHSAYVRQVVLTETTLGAFATGTDASPFVTLPSASVFVRSSFPDGTEALRSLGFGGNSLLRAYHRTVGLTLGNQINWFSTNNRHRLRLTSELRHDLTRRDQSANSFGTFAFASLADLEANRPASFSRSLGSRVLGGRQLIAGFSLGDSYRRSSTLHLQYGVRLDANRFSRQIAFNDVLLEQLGLRNDVVPNRLYASPRIGFSWQYGRAPTLAAFEGAAIVPRAVLRGGVGVFQGLPAADALATAEGNTGLPGGVQQVTCIGVATPSPDWLAYQEDASAIPSACREGSTGLAVANVAPNASLFASGWHAPRSIRGNLQWTGPLVGNRIMATVEGLISRNQNQSSTADANFRSSVGFVLAVEGRPVFVPPTTVVPQSGIVPIGESRVSRLFGRVSELRSDLLGESRQLRVSLRPMAFSSSRVWSLSYVWSNSREQYRGFTSTAHDPRTVAWSRGTFEARHQFTYSLGYNLQDAVRINWSGRVQSGLPFTPRVSSDINGDGFATDRAFVFDPLVARDSSLAAGMQALLLGTSGPTNNCLRQQVGQIAERNSCRGPWTSSANMSLSLNPRLLGLSQRAAIAVLLDNPLGAIDLALHGARQTRGWGQSALPDETLLYVRGFDPSTSRFSYDVNPRFGRSSPAFSSYRSPVTITLQVRWDLGASRERQVLTQTLDRGRSRSGDRLTEGVLRAMYGSAGLLNPMAHLIRQSDTLGLNGRQVDSLANMNRAYIIALDSIWSIVASELAHVPTRYNQSTAYRQYRRAREQSIDLLRSSARRVNDLLTPEQRRKLPSLVARHLDERYLLGVRSGTEGDAAGGTFGRPLGGSNAPGAPRVQRVDIILP